AGGMGAPAMSVEKPAFSRPVAIERRQVRRSLRSLLTHASTCASTSALVSSSIDRLPEKLRTAWSAYNCGRVRPLATKRAYAPESCSRAKLTRFLLIVRASGDGSPDRPEALVPPRKAGSGTALTAAAGMGSAPRARRDESFRDELRDGQRA